MLKILIIYLSKNLFELVSIKPEAVRSAPLTGVRGKTFTEKMQKRSKEII